jgi:hypothetical protein
MRRLRVNALSFILFGATSCSFFTTPRQTTFHHQEDAGTVQVAVQSVAPFEDYISTLEPKFTLSTQDALSAALTQTQTEDSQIIRELLANVSVALPQITRTTSKKSSLDGTTTTTTETVDHESKPGTVGDVKTGDPQAKAADASLPTSAAGVDFDQSLKYRAAAALLQEVSLLNHYVRDAAVSTGTRPYIVRMLVTVLPSARNEPYDAYTTISFFTDPASKPATSWAYRALATPTKAQITDEMTDSEKEAALNTATVEKTAIDAIKQNVRKWSCSMKPVAVIPLLVTDDLESSLHQNTANVIRDLAAALSGTLSNVGFGAAARNRAQDLDKTLNRNLNSIFALGQAGPNAVQARLGAAYANGRYVTVARTYNVSLLVMVKSGAGEVGFLKEIPEEAGNVPEVERHITSIASEVIPCPGLVFTAQTEMRNVEKGKRIASATDSARRRTLETLTRAIDPPSGSTNIQSLFDTAVMGDFDRFSIAYGAGSEKRTAFAWTQALAIVQASGWSSGEFRVPLSEVTLPAVGDQFTVFDDGKVAKLTINNASNILPDRLRAALKVQTSDPNREWLFLIDDNVEVGPDGRRATFTFPSVAGILGHDVTTKNVFAAIRYMPGLRNWQTGGTKVSLDWHATSPLRDCNKNPKDEVCIARDRQLIQKDEVPIAYFLAPKKEPPEPGYSIRVPSPIIRTGPDGVGELAIEIRSDDPKAPKQVHVLVDSGAYIDDVTPALAFVGADRVASDGAYVIKLKNLRPGTKVALNTFRLDDKNPVPFKTTPIDVVAKP